MSDDKLEFEGTVVDANRDSFKVQVSDNYTVLCKIGGKIRINSVRILLGDRVKIEVSPYDPSQGRIVYRIKGA